MWDGDAANFGTLLLQLQNQTCLLQIRGIRSHSCLYRWLDNASSANLEGEDAKYF